MIVQITGTNIFHDLNKDQIFPKPSHDQISNEEI